jgi:hypothetical protein
VSFPAGVAYKRSLDKKRADIRDGIAMLVKLLGAVGIDLDVPLDFLGNGCLVLPYAGGDCLEGHASVQAHLDLDPVVKGQMLEFCRI